MISVVWLLLALSVFLLISFQKWKAKGNSLQRLPPGPRGVPLLGNFLQLDYSAPHRRLWELSQRYGPLMFLRLGFKPTIVVSSMKLANEVTKSHDLVFAYRPSYLSQRKLSYEASNVAHAPHATYWRKMKKFYAVHLLNNSSVQRYRSIREFEVFGALERISKLGLASKSVDLSEAIMSLMGSIIYRVTFGKEMNDIEHSRRVHKLTRLSEEAEAMLTSFFFSDYSPLLGFVDKLSGRSSQLENLFNRMDNFYENLIQEHLDPNRPLPDEQEYIIDMLLKFMKDDSSKLHITIKHIKGVLMDLCLGGIDSNAAAVIWAMTYLMKNPESMKKAQKEVRYVIGRKGFVNEDDIEKLTYLKAAVKETMRLQPAIPLVPRETSECCNLDDYQIPAKTLVYINLWAIGRDPEASENPHEFCPERFINNTNESKDQNVGLLVPFGAGRRICPGIFMALVTVELILANLLYKFDWEMPPGFNNQDLDMDVQPGIAMTKKNALLLLPTNYI